MPAGRAPRVAVEVKFQETANWFSAKSIGLEYAGFKLLTEKNSGKILGAHVLGSHAEEVINIFALAIRLGLTVHDLKRAVWAYPTAVSDIAYLLD
jgi:glutathione reductase (NADPH)